MPIDFKKILRSMQPKPANTYEWSDIAKQAELQKQQAEAEETQRLLAEAKAARERNDQYIKARQQALDGTQGGAPVPSRGIASVPSEQPVEAPSISPSEDSQNQIRQMHDAAGNILKTGLTPDEEDPMSDFYKIREKLRR